MQDKNMSTFVHGSVGSSSSSIGSISGCSSVGGVSIGIGTFGESLTGGVGFASEPFAGGITVVSFAGGMTVVSFVVDPISSSIFSFGSASSSAFSSSVTVLFCAAEKV